MELLSGAPRLISSSASGDRRLHAEAIAAGASGVLSKTVGSAEIIGAIRRLVAGEALLSPSEAIALFRLADQRREAERSTHRLIAQLTPRERDLLRRPRSPRARLESA